MTFATVPFDEFLALREATKVADAKPLIAHFSSGRRRRGASPETLDYIRKRFEYTAVLRTLDVDSPPNAGTLLDADTKYVPKLVLFKNGKIVRGSLLRPSAGNEKGRKEIETWFTGHGMASLIP